MTYLRTRYRTWYRYLPDGVLRRCAILSGICLFLVTISSARGSAVTGLRDEAPRPAHSFMLQLAAPPVAEWLTQSALSADANQTRATTQAYLAQVETAQAAVLETLDELGIPILFRTQRVYNGIAVRATPDQVAQLRQLAGVAAVHRLLAKEPDNAVSVPLIGAYALWQGGELPAVRGEGMRIAVIDTGVDYHHMTFGGSGDGYAQNDPTVGDDAADYPSFKVVGGYDFAGDDYDAEERSFGSSAVPTPDADPLDCYGHGTHVAGTAAGFGVTAAGTPYRGPFDESSSAVNFRVGPGVAPLAQIFALKIFGCSGSSDLTDLAIEWAVDPNGDGDFSDRFDVINLSLGSPYGANDDTSAVAADNAAALGVIVVASAGNSRDRSYVVGAPSVATRVVSVAASQQSFLDDPTAPNAAVSLAGFSSRGPRRGDALLKPDLAAPGANVVSAASRSGSLGVTLSGTSMAAPHVAGAMTLLRQLHPDWSVEELKALTMNSALPLLYPGNMVTPTLYSPAAVGAGEIDLHAAARAASLLVNASLPGAVSMSFGTPPVANQLTMTSQVRLINRGAMTQTYRLSYASVTDMSGVDIVAPTAPVTVPAGARMTATILLEADAAQMGMGIDSTLSGATLIPRSVFGEEVGYLLAWPAGNRSMAALDLTGAPGEPPTTMGTAAFHFDPGLRTLHYTVEVTTSAPVAIQEISIAYVNSSGGEPLRLPLVAASDGITVPARMVGSLALPPSFQLWLASDLLEVVASAGEGVDVLARGRMQAQAPVPRIPIYAAPHTVAGMSAQPTETTLLVGATASSALTLTGNPAAGSPPTGTLSLVSALELQLRSPNERPASLAERETDRYDHADLAYVGVAAASASAASAESQDEPADWLYVGVAMHAPWSSPNEVRVTLDIHVDDDRTPDFRLSNGDELGYNAESPASDAFVSVLQNLKTRIRTVEAPLNAVNATEADTRPFASRVLVLPVRLQDLGLAGVRSTLHFTVTTYSQDLEDGDAPVDTTPLLTYNLGSPMIDFGNAAPRAPLFADAPGQILRLKLSAPPADPARAGVLLLHHHNDSEGQVEVIPVRVTWPHNLYLPAISR